MEKWIAAAVGKMHIHGISQIELASHMNVTNDYISLILRGKRAPKNSKERILTAIDEVIKQKNLSK